MRIKNRIFKEYHWKVLIKDTNTSKVYKRKNNSNNIFRHLSDSKIKNLKSQLQAQIKKLRLIAEVQPK